jgi:fructokinase
MAEALRLGVDLGGTKIEACALGPDGAPRARRRVPAPAGGYAAVVRAVAGLVQAVEAEAGGAAARGIGVGIPGSPSPATGHVRNANATALNGRPLGADLEAALGRPVRLANDANCFALAEAREGAGRGAEMVLGLILGTGAGAGIAVGGRVLEGRNRIAGEWGHTPLPAPRAAERPGPLCWCGRRGCAEAWISGPALARDHAAATGAPADPPAIAAAAGAGDPAARASLARHLDRLARALAAVVNVLDPHVIVLGGGLSNLGHLAGALPAALAPHVFSDTFDTPVRTNALGDSAGVLGAARLWDGAGPALSSPPTRRTP